ncbi:prolyl 4-hydroxylase subunit alpha-1-like [Tubulanus polymorphus]|uniref:prolyl 4-hydroxylase subunit alpha-1-like n=1 Tax=Tubulanus polymorphus TaxID=672921 RepID=UPI003DA606D7
MNLPTYFSLLTVCLFLSGNSISAQTFTAVAKLKLGFGNEGYLLKQSVKLFEKVTESTKENDIFKGFQRFVLDVKERWNKERLDANFLNHPVNIFHHLKRLVNGWQHWLGELEKLDSDKAIENFLDDYQNMKKESKGWPQGDEDVKGAALALIRLRNVYFISFDELAQGRLNGTVHDALTADEFREIGIAAYSKHDYLLYEAVDWLTYFVELVRRGAQSSYSLARALKLLASVYNQHGDLQKTVQLIREAKEIDPTNAAIKGDMKYYENKFQRAPEEERSKPLHRYIEPYAAEWRPKYEALCRHDVQRSKEYVARLKCYHRRTKIPYRPADVEIVSLGPKIALFHNVIHETEMNYIKKKAVNMLFRSNTVADDGKGYQAVESRVSETGWIDDTDPVVKTLSTRVSIMTGLNVDILERASGAEYLQVLNYGVGGMYEPHYDYFDEIGTGNRWNLPAFLETSGNRLATWMYYMNDVSFGGSTVFPYADASVPVVKGAAVFWLNLKRNGSYDTRTLHAGCPVLIGSKWVSNKWVHEGPQFRTWPCKLDQYS